MHTIRITAGSSLSNHIIRILRRTIEEKAEELVRRLTDLGVQVARTEFAEAIYDGTNDVSVTFEERGPLTRAVIATGSATLFIEYGTGINFPTHPDPDAFPHGTYGSRLGSLPNGWRYPAEKGAGTNGEADPEHPGYIKTMGNPANAPMYKARKEIEQEFRRIAREVFTS